MRGLSSSVAALALAVTIPPSVAAAAGPSDPRPPDGAHFWAAGELGFGALAIGSDQEARTNRTRFSMGLKLGASIRHAVRLGVMVDGWLVQSADVNDPAEGAGVTEVFAVGQFYPMRGRGFFVVAGGGYAAYHDNRPSGFDSHGCGGTVGAGYDFRLAPHLEIYPVLTYDRGDLGDVRNSLTTLTHRSYAAVTLRAGIAYR